MSTHAAWTKWVETWGAGWMEIAAFTALAPSRLRQLRREEPNAPEEALLEAGCARMEAIAVLLGVQAETALGWLDTPLVGGSGATPGLIGDWLGWGSAQEGLERLAGARGEAETRAVLAQLRPDWEKAYHSCFEVFDADEGERSIRLVHDPRTCPIVGEPGVVGEDEGSPAA